MIEIWKDIKGFEDLYQISNFGKVKSLDRFYTQWRGGKTPVFGKTLNTWVSYGYINVRLSVEGKRTSFLVHRLVAIHFINNPENKPTVNHKDSNKLNNNVCNLEWATQKENIAHSYKSGLAPTGCNRTQSKLSDKDVFEIRKMYNRRKCGYVEVAKNFNVSARAIYNIIKNKTYKNNGYLEM